jgi:hypothetical protein
VDLHACAWGQLAAFGHSADLMFSNSVASGWRNGVQGSSCTATILSSRCPLWVKSGHRIRRASCRFTPESGHQLCALGCRLCAKSGHRIAMSRSDHLVGAKDKRPRKGDTELFAVLRFKTSFNLVGCSTGRSAGFACGVDNGAQFQLNTRCHSS